VLGAGCWVLGAGCWVLGAGCWVLGAGPVQPSAFNQSFSHQHSHSHPVMPKTEKFSATSDLKE